MLNFLPPDVSAPVSSQPRRAGARPTYPDGRLIPQPGDEVTKLVPGPFGEPAVLVGVIVGARVRIKGGRAVVGVIPVGKRVALDGSWTVRNDPEILRRRAEEEAQRAAEAQAKLDSAAREEAAKVAAQAARGVLTADQIRVGDLLEDDDGIRWWVEQINDRGEPYGIAEDNWSEWISGGYLGNDLRGWRILERGMADPRPAAEPEDDAADATFQPGDLIETDDAYPHYGTVIAVHTAAALGYDPDTEGRFLYRVHWTRNSRGESIERLNKPGDYTKQVYLRPSRRPDYSKAVRANAGRALAAPTLRAVAQAVAQLERAVDEPDRLTPAVLRVLRAAGWREGDPVHDPRVDYRQFDAQAVVSDLSGPGFDLASYMWR